MPNILGMNFQQVRVGQKLPVGGYTDAAGTPSALLAGAIAHVDASLGRMVSAPKANGLYESTLIIVSAKHGQSPIDFNNLAMESGGSANATVTHPLGFINAADPNVDHVSASFVNPNDGSSPAVKGHLQTDDTGILWLQDQSATNIANVIGQLTDPAHEACDVRERSAPRHDLRRERKQRSGARGDLRRSLSGDPLAAARAPNVIIQPNWGVIYSGSSKKIAEHGGGTLDDTHVALTVSNPRLHGRTIQAHVWTRQVAPTILRALGLAPEALEAVRKEPTRSLPGIGF